MYTEYIHIYIHDPDLLSAGDEKSQSLYLTSPITAGMISLHDNLTPAFSTYLSWDPQVFECLLKGDPWRLIPIHPGNALGAGRMVALLIKCTRQTWKSTQPSFEYLSSRRNFSPYYWQTAIIPGRHDNNGGQLNGEDHIVMTDCNIFKQWQIICRLDGHPNLVLNTSMSGNLITLWDFGQAHPPLYVDGQFGAWTGIEIRLHLGEGKLTDWKHAVAWCGIAKPRMSFILWWLDDWRRMCNIWVNSWTQA